MLELFRNARRQTVRHWFGDLLYYLTRWPVPADFIGKSNGDTRVGNIGKTPGIMVPSSGNKIHQEVWPCGDTDSVDVWEPDAFFGHGCNLHKYEVVFFSLNVCIKRRETLFGARRAVLEARRSLPQLCESDKFSGLLPFSGRKKPLNPLVKQHLSFNAQNGHNKASTPLPPH